MSMVTGVLLGLVALRYAGTATWLAWSWLVATGVVLAVIDIQHRRLPYRETVAMALGGAVSLAGAAMIENRWTSFLAAILSAALVLAIAAAVQLLWPGHTGGGDTLLYGTLALYLGWFGVSGLARGMLLATGFTSLVAITVWCLRRRRSTTIPAGPTLIAGTVLEVLLH
ncbi:prepilin peptidase [Haloechinothrix salitolerans]|uniref:Prepilin peptidase n=1 Tax=Haloechinothrix salitolerans TaxID=926830 RepID=A0ABW2C6A9_9PSEU